MRYPKFVALNNYTKSIIVDAIEKFLLDLPEAKRLPAMEIREIFLSVDKNITEAIKWNNLTFSVGKNNIAFIYTYKHLDYINLGFMQAVKLSDPKKLFEGTGQNMRHIKIKTAEDIPAAQIKKWVKEAMLLP